MNQKAGAGSGATTNTGTPNWTSGQGNGLVGATNPATPGTATNTNALQPAAASAAAAPTNIANSQTAPVMAPPATPALGAPTPQQTTGTPGTGSTTASTAPSNTGTPPTSAALTPGTQAYNNMNTLLSTLPMQTVVNMMQQGGLTPEMTTVMNNLLNSTGANDWMTNAANLFSQLGTGQAAQDFQNVYTNAGQPGAAQQNLSNMAAGGMINNNPYLNDIVSQAEQDASTNVNQMFAAGGRYGSGMDQGTVGQAVANVNNQLRSDQLNKDLANMLSSNQLISGEQIGRLGLQNTAAGGLGTLQTAGATGLGGLGQNAMSNWLQAQGGAAQIGNAGQQNILSAMGLLPTVQNNKVFDANQQTQVGATIDAKTQQQITDLVKQWQSGDMEAWQKLGGLLSAASGSAGNYGTQTSTTKQTSTPGWLDILGLALSA